MHNVLGDYLDGAFAIPSDDSQGRSITSHNPARDGADVFQVRVSVEHMNQACDAASRAVGAWAGRSMDERWHALGRFRDALRERAEPLADAIVAETGKLRSEAKGEVGALISRFDLVRGIAERELQSGPVPGHGHEQLRFNPLGVVGVIGPFNYPLHLCHAYVVPALLLGNPVVVKPSEVTPLAGQCYAEAAHAAGLPAGVFNLVQGDAAGGQALIAHPAVRGLCFTGSYAVGRMITEQALDRPELLLSLEMGGKNTVVVLDDASVRQAAHEIAIGGYLTTGQRCTATDRVLVDRRVRDGLLAALRPMVEAIRFGDPDDPESFAGPMATASSRARFLAAVKKAQAAGAEPVVSGERAQALLAGLTHPSHYVGASLHVLPEGVHDIAGYTDEELFGPDLGIEVVDGDEHAIELINRSPYGFANSVFTGSGERFENVYRNTRSGILNRNRSTNKASPRLPFGGVGKSGNYRPAGLYAVRNVVVPVAVQDNVIGTMDVHPMLAAHLPQPDLDRLEARHEADEAAEAARRLLDEPRPGSLGLPTGGRVPTSDAWLTRLYAGNRVVREKKPLIFDHLRSYGPWMVSIDERPLSVLDGMSQTATLTGGFADDTVVRNFIEGGFGGTLLDNADTALGDSDAAGAMADTLRRLVPGLPHVSFANSGAEANEKAFALCRLHVMETRGAAADKARKVLAFEGSFHGRTLLSLHATYNPIKREPFEIAGYQQTFAPFPVWSTPGDPQPSAPAGFYAAVARGDRDALVDRFGSSADDSLLAAEVRSLVAVHDGLLTGEHFACIVEPMQAEGGDRYATDRFFRALRLLTRHHQTPLIFDEVQSGFALGGPFAWHTSFRLVDFRGQPDFPDAVTLAKRAQVGVVMSRFDDPEPTSAHEASLVRGRLHAEIVSTADNAERLEALCKPRLEAIARAFPHLVSGPRGRGYAFAFDLPSRAHMMAYLGQRFWRGAVVFGAGTRTIRYRLSDAFLAREVDLLFVSIRRSLAWLDAHPHARPPAWDDLTPPPEKRRERPEIRVRDIADTAESVSFLPAILDIELDIYEPARRTPPDEIRAALEIPDGDHDGRRSAGRGRWGQQLEAVWLCHWHAVGANRRSRGRGPRSDAGSKQHTVFSNGYSRRWLSGHGPWALAQNELSYKAAAARRRDDGSPRFRYVTSRNRVGHTASMSHLNRVFGAHVVCVLTGQYEDPEGQAIYYRIPIGALTPEPDLASVNSSPGQTVDQTISQTVGNSTIDLASGLCRPLSAPPASLVRAANSGLVYGPAVNKITLMNYATTGMVRALEWISALMPETAAYVPDFVPRRRRGQNRCASSGITAKTCRWPSGWTVATSGTPLRPPGRSPIHGSTPKGPGTSIGRGSPTLAKSESPPASPPCEQPCPRPAARAGYFGFHVRSGPGAYRQGPDRRVPAGPWGRLRAELDIPLIAVETVTGSYRTATGPFAHSRASIKPDILMWWSGGQTGYLHVAPRFFVAKPLTMVSTWDGDELSLLRHHHQLRALRSLDMSAGLAALDDVLAGASERGLSARGLGGYRVLEADDATRAESLAEHLAGRGIRVRRFANGCLGLAPAMDRLTESADALRAALAVW